jgi:hypothetical protein
VAGWVAHGARTDRIDRGVIENQCRTHNDGKVTDLCDALLEQ